MGHSWATLTQDFTLTEATAALLSRRVVAVADQRDGIDLDYTPHSLLAVDHIVESFRITRRRERAGALLALGCYVGEVVARQAGGHWQASAATGDAEGSLSPVVLCMPGGTRLDPIAAVHGRHQQGGMRSVFVLFRSLIDLSRCA